MGSYEELQKGDRSRADGQLERIKSLKEQLREEKELTVTTGFEGQEKGAEKDRDDRWNARQNMMLNKIVDVCVPPIS